MVENALWVTLAGVGIAGTAWLGLAESAWNDYERESRPAFEALVHGHVLSFLELAPAYGGSLVLRAPFALLPGVWGGGQLAVYRMVALPCLLALGALAVWLALRIRRDRQGRLTAAVALALCVANPVAVYALEFGHPEDLLCATLSIAAVVCACGKRTVWAGVLAGLAIATKAWGLIALAPVLASLPACRPRAAVIAVLCAALVLTPLALARPGKPLASSGAAAAQTGALFQPWQAWWWLGSSSKVVHTASGQVRAGYRAPPAWVPELVHPLIVLLAIPFSLLWLRRRSNRPWDAIGLLALLLLARCLLDPWNNVYYAFPFLLALTAWEALARRRPPLLALLATMMVPLTFEVVPSYLSPDGQSAFFLAWSLPLAAVLAHALYAPWEKLVDERKGLRQTREPFGPIVAHQR